MQEKKFLQRIRGYLFSGILVTAPLAVTVYIIWLITGSIDQLAAHLLPEYLVNGYQMPLSIPGLGFIIVILLLILIGALTRGVIGAFFVSASERMLAKLPIVRSIYAGSKQIFEAFFGNKSLSFRQVGMIEYPRKGIWSLCFITGTTKGEVQTKTADNVVNVFVPTTPNPTSGFLLFVPMDEIILIDMRVEEGIKMVVSAGIVTPPYIPQKSLDEPLPEMSKKMDETFEETKTK